jgi:hypothetical protein
MFYLIGVAHRVQTFENPGAQNEGHAMLAGTIRDCIEQFAPRVIAEEHSREALGARHSIAQQLAEEHKLEHRFCDPESDWRKAVGYKGRDQLEMEIFTHSWDVPPNDIICGRAGAIEMILYFPMRERRWLECLADMCAENVVFICGQAHIGSFSELLRSNGIDVTVVAERIGVNPKDDQLMTLAHEYLAAHPDPITDEPGVGNL